MPYKAIANCLNVSTMTYLVYSFVLIDISDVFYFVVVVVVIVV